MQPHRVSLVEETGGGVRMHESDFRGLRGVRRVRGVRGVRGGALRARRLKPSRLPGRGGGGSRLQNLSERGGLVRRRLLCLAMGGASGTRPTRPLLGFLS